MQPVVPSLSLSLPPPPKPNPRRPQGLFHMLGAGSEALLETPCLQASVSAILAHTRLHDGHGQSQSPDA